MNDIAPYGAERPPSPPQFLLRPVTPADESALSALLMASYGTLLAPDYHSNVLAAALPIIGRPKPALLSAPGYRVAEARAGQVIAAGGWTWFGPTGGAAPMDWGHVRHVAVDPRYAGRGLGGILINDVIENARAAGVRVLSCLSTLTARGFYAHHGFHDQGDVDLSLDLGLRFPAVQMRRVL